MDFDARDLQHEKDKELAVQAIRDSDKVSNRILIGTLIISASLFLLALCFA